MPKPKTPDALTNRLKTLRKRVRDAEYDAVLVINPVDTRYLTGFVGDDSWTLVPARGTKVYVLSDARFEEQIAREAPHAVAIMRKKSLVDELKTLRDRLKLTRVAVQKGSLTVARFEAIKKGLGARGVAAWDDGLITQRAVKDADEVKLIVKAGRIQQQAFRELQDFMEPGQTEAEVAAFSGIPHALPGGRRRELPVHRGGRRQRGPAARDPGPHEAEEERAGADRLGREVRRLLLGHDAGRLHGRRAVEAR